MTISNIVKEMETKGRLLQSESGERKRESQKKSDEIAQLDNEASRLLTAIRQCIVDAVKEGVSFASELDEVLLKRLDAIEQHLGRLKASKLAALAKSRQLEDQLSAAIRAQHEADEALVTLRDRIELLTQSDASAAPLLDELANNRVLSDRLTAQVDELNRECTAKRKTFESNPYFMYLYKRSYGTVLYRRNALVARFDRWMSDRLDFINNHRSYQMLFDRPQHVLGLLDTAKKRRAELELSIEGVREKYRKLHDFSIAESTARTSLAVVSKGQHDVLTCDSLLQSLTQEIEQISTGQHQLQRDLLEVVADAETTTPLAQLVAQTPTLCDDELLERYHSTLKLRALRYQEEENLSNLAKRSERDASQIINAARVLSRAHSGYSNSRIRFAEESIMAALHNGDYAGLHELSSDVQRRTAELKREADEEAARQRRREQERQDSYSYSSSHSSSSSFGGGSHSSGGGFGGGGFSSGGSF